MNQSLLQVLKYEDTLYDLSLRKDVEELFYFLKNPKELNLKINSLNKLRKEVFNSDIPTYHKTNILERIDSNLSYLGKIQQYHEDNKKTLILVAAFSLIVGILGGAIGKIKFDDLLQKYEQKFKNSVKEELKRLNRSNPILS
jgi:hypothetical protein